MSRNVRPEHQIFLILFVQCTFTGEKEKQHKLSNNHPAPWSSSCIKMGWVHWWPHLLVVCMQWNTSPFFSSNINATGAWTPHGCRPPHDFDNNKMKCNPLKRCNASRLFWSSLKLRKIYLTLHVFWQGHVKKCSKYTRLLSFNITSMCDLFCNYATDSLSEDMDELKCKRIAS